VKNFFSFIILLISLNGFATHNRAGEIRYKRIAPFTNVVGGVTVPVFNYSITIITYTDDGNGIADRCEDTVYFGDNQRGIAKRINGTASCGPGCAACGDVILPDPSFRVKINIYTIQHTYSGAGTYTIQMFDPNRNAGVNNIPNSDQQPFYLESVLVITNFSGANSSPEFNNPPTDRACQGQCFYHNPAAYDVDGDSLSFEITTSRGQGGETVPGYSFPNPGVGGTYNIDAVSGLLTWCSPQVKGQYNIAFIVKEWRKNTSGSYTLIGAVLRDMQIIVVACNNQPPVVIVPADTCVEAGSKIVKNIFVTDPQPAPNSVSLKGAGGAFAALPLGAALTLTGTQTPYTAVFSWQTSCEHVRQQPYQTVFKAEDPGNPGISSSPLVSFSTYNIKVVPPSVKNVSATPQGSTIKVVWSLSTCSPSENRLLTYQVYRKNDCVSYTHAPCATGVDPASGFKFIGQTSANTDSFIDNNNGNGLLVGQNYSYIVIAVYDDGTETFGSAPVCARLKRDIPVILNVDVRATSSFSGSVFLRWNRPLTNTGNLDTIALPGPYRFTVKYRSGAGGSFVAVQDFTSPFILKIDTSFVHTGINTSDSSADYSIEFSAGTSTIGTSPLASSIFLNASPDDRKISLTWKSNTPWLNYKYIVYRSNPGSTTFSAIATTTANNYIDSNKVVNRNTYCYKVLGEGQYSDPSIFKPLTNFSQETCVTAKDLQSPCTPTLVVEADCPKGIVNVSWNDVRKICSDDVVRYVLFYKATINTPYTIVDSFNLNITSYPANDFNTPNDLNLISGCYAIQSVDSSGNASLLSPDFCVDNCPEFELPNIFTPNNDKTNDFFKAIKVRQIQEIDLVVLDRWGNLVYRSKDPYFQWDGISVQSKQIVSDGTFFYTCDVFEPRLTGLRKRAIRGYVQVVR
jgi:gliding motility-associated-like protein